MIYQHPMKATLQDIDSEDYPEDNSEQIESLIDAFTNNEYDPEDYS